MTDKEYRESRYAEIQVLSRRHFNANLTVKALLFEDIPIAKGATATIFSTPDHHIYALCANEDTAEPLRLRDVQRAIKAMGFQPAAYGFPYGDRDYFYHQGYEAFRTAYPGRSEWTAPEEAFYKTLATYSPALVRLTGVTGQIRRYNEFDDQWQPIYDPPIEMVAVNRITK